MSALKEMKNFGQVLRHTAKRLPDKIAMVCNGQRYSYKRFEEESNRIASALEKSGVCPGDRIALLTHNCVEFIAIVFGCAKLGAIPVKLNWRLAPEELSYLIDFNDCKVMFYRYNNVKWHSQLHELLADKDMLFIGLDRTERSTLCYEDFIATGSSEYEITFTDENAPLMHLHTSGSSGKPKTVVYSHRAFLNQLENCIDGLGFYEDMVFLSMSQMFHSACVGLYACIAIGARSVVFSRFDPQQYLKAINDEHITRVSAIPTVLQGLLNQPNLDEFNFSSVHTIGYSAAPMSPALIDKAISYFHCGFMQSYGMTEMASIVTILQPEDHIRDNYKHLYSVGKPIKDVELKIIDQDGNELSAGKVGRIAIKGAGMMLGYYRQPEKTAQVIKNGWYISDDLGYLDEEGFLTLSGRVSDLIITGGENVFAQEIENLLMRQEDVEECTVFGTPDEYWGEKVTACVVPKDGVSLSAELIAQYCREHIAGFKVPKKIILADRLPRNTVGKIDKPKVIELYTNKEK